MKCELTISEKLKDLRTAKGLNLEQLEQETGISKSALGSYESNEYKEIPHPNIVKLAQYYNVSTDYLLGLSDNITNSDEVLSEIHLDDSTVDILKSGSINNRLLCEIIKHPDFRKFMSDMEIYIDSMASMQIDNLNAFVAIMRSKIQLKNEIPDTDHYIQTLKASEVNENDYFSRLIGFDITKIAKDIKDQHSKDKETGNTINPLSDVIDIVQEYSNATTPMKATLTTLSKQLGMNFHKMDPAEVQFFVTLIEKYSSAYQSMIPKKGRGKK